MCDIKPPFEGIYCSESPFEPRFKRRIKQEEGLPIHISVREVEQVPGDTTEREIDLAERILKTGGNRTGFNHHEDVRQSMQKWAPNRNEDRDEDPGYWRKIVFVLSPKERNFGKLTGADDEKMKKARTILAWARETISRGVLKEIEKEQAEEIQQAYRDAVQDAIAQQKRTEFEKDPPQELNGWKQVDPSHLSVELAYQGVNYGTPCIAVIFKQKDGGLDAQEFTLENWNGNPRTTRTNRHLVTSKGSGAFAQLYSHLHTFEADPLPDQSTVVAETVEKNKSVGKSGD